MSNKDIDPVKRREVLKNTAIAGAASLGAVTSVGSVAADSDDKLAVLEAEGVVLSESQIDTLAASEDIEIPDEVRTGQTLLERLTDEGLLAEASLDVLPDFDASGDADGQVHHLGEPGEREVAFTTPTPRGRLQVTFDENSPPSAALFPRDGGSVIMYTAPDGENYERVETDIETTGSSNRLSTNNDCDGCGGCDCVSNWCVDGWKPKSKKNTCASCDNGECIITNICGC